MSALATFTVVGVLDAVLTVARTPAIVRTLALAAGVLFHTVTVYVLLGLVFGSVQQSVHAALSRSRSRRFALAARLATPLIAVAVLALAYGWMRARGLAKERFDRDAAIGVASLVILDTVAFFARWPRTWRLGTRARLGVAALLVTAIATSAITLGRPQSVLSTIAIRSVLTRRLIPAFQVIVDRDGDGYGAAFAGGDCDDDNPSIHPGAVDVPGNGVDENCSGRDARIVPRDPRTGYVPLVGASSENSPSFLFVTIDTLRPDHVGTYGYERPTTPNIDAFMARGAHFTNAYAVAPQSVRSFSSVFTGRTPAAIDWRWDGDVQFPALALENTTLAEILRARGYATAAFVNTSYFDLTDGFYQGFETTETGHLFEDDADRTVKLALSWLDRHAASERRFFAWIHLIDPHEPYVDHVAPRDFGQSTIDRYDEEIAHVDNALVPLLRRVNTLDTPTRPVVVFVFGDHGEAFGEHGRRYHSQDVHEEVLRVPLMVRGPGIVPGARPQLVALMDVHSTVLNYLGQRAEPRVTSRSLVDVLQSPARAFDAVRRDVAVDVLLGGNRYPGAVALIAPPYKLVHDLTRNAWELYDIENDRAEADNLYDAQREVAAALEDRLDDAVEE